MSPIVADLLPHCHSESRNPLRIGHAVNMIDTGPRTHWQMLGGYDRLPIRVQTQAAVDKRKAA